MDAEGSVVTLYTGCVAGYKNMCEMNAFHSLISTEVYILKVEI
jgi:hypothetical protein